MKKLFKNKNSKKLRLWRSAIVSPDKLKLFLELNLVEFELRVDWGRATSTISGEPLMSETPWHDMGDKVKCNIFIYIDPDR